MKALRQAQCDGHMYTSTSYKLRAIPLCNTFRSVTEVLRRLPLWPQTPKIITFTPPAKPSRPYNISSKPECITSKGHYHPSKH